MSLTTRIRLLALVSATATAMMLTGCNGGGGSDDPAGGTTGSTTGSTTGGTTTGGSTTGGTTGGTTGTTTGGTLGGLTGGGAVGAVYVSLDGGGDLGTADTYAANLSSRTASFNTGLNEGIDSDNGSLNAVGSIAGVATLRRIANFPVRGNANFDPAFDKEYKFPEIVAPRGITVAGLTSNQLIVADAPTAVAGEDPVSVPSLHLISTLFGATPPVVLKTIPLSVAGGRTWDVAYDAFVDRLYAAMTNGTIAVYDNFLVRANLSAVGGAAGPAVTPSRTITPGSVSGGTSSKVSVNLHGISYNRSTNQLVVSDVGSPTSDSDGALFVIDNASTANDATTGSGPAIVVPSRSISGAATLLGNPVDVLLRSDGSLYVAEKLNGGGQILVFNGILTSGGGNIAPNLHVTTSSLGSSGTPESITEAD
ncbi:hypothetical protein [Nevskia ramosa]|uniref:hypothetical protein n=1 Tax=Nevskia ramosa TaxID=64002 RepID=UPI0012ECA924|nr:hypothetical protein [Nevskia ramosa]